MPRCSNARAGDEFGKAFFLRRRQRFNGRPWRCGKRWHRGGPVCGRRKVSRVSVIRPNTTRATTRSCPGGCAHVVRVPGVGSCTSASTVVDHARHARRMAIGCPHDRRVMAGTETMPKELARIARDIPQPAVLCWRMIYEQKCRQQGKAVWRSEHGSFPGDGTITSELDAHVLASFAKLDQHQPGQAAPRNRKSAARSRSENLRNRQTFPRASCTVGLAMSLRVATAVRKVV